MLVLEKKTHKKTWSLPRTQETGVLDRALLFLLHDPKQTNSPLRLSVSVNAEGLGDLGPPNSLFCDPGGRRGPSTPCMLGVPGLWGRGRVRAPRTWGPGSGGTRRKSKEPQ